VKGDLALNGIEDRRATLSAEKRALLEKRLKGLTVAAAEPRPPVAAAPEVEPADTADLTPELAPGAVPPVDREIWHAMVEAGSEEARRRALAPDLVADAAHESRHDQQAAAFLGSAFRQLTRNIEETLRHVLRLLSPGGVLLFLEETRFQRKYNFSMGFLPGFDDFEDYDLRPLHPLLSSAQWRRELLTAGFVDFATFTEPGSAAEVLGVDVMLARAAGGF
jgi:hypothetical protein